MKQRLKLPVGIDDFEKIRSNEFYYVDKTKLIEQLLQNWGEVSLFTRPRRFGKTLNMSMLKCFFEIGTDPALFDGLYISGNRELCDIYMGKYPVIFLSLKGVEGLTFEEAKENLQQLIGNEAGRFSFLKESPELSDEEKQQYLALTTFKEGRYVFADSTLTFSLQILSRLLHKHYGQKTVILIDEYDVPLDKAFQNGYYREMVALIRGLLGQALKTNPSLQFAVLTGCLRVAKESIFTGLNNFKINSITNVAFDEYFGFTNTEIKNMLHYYELDACYETVREWYDGYRFGNTDIYCPWDVINYCSDHLMDSNSLPKNYWINTSGNDVINHFIDSLDQDGQLTKSELEHLVCGDVIQKEIHEELTYQELYDSIDNLWSALFMTGYLTQRGSQDGEMYDLIIPNREIRNVIVSRILTRFKQRVRQDGEMVKAFCTALYDGKSEEVERLFRTYMAETISVRDTFIQKPLKENFYHGLLLGILSFKDGWMVRSNRESGNGFSDIMIQIDDSDTGIIIEVKYDEKNDLEMECQKAIQQINETGYTNVLHQQDVHRILKYGIACKRKDCRVLLEMG